MSEYEVGYKKPPKHSQFKPGQSGNPKGRKKGQKNFKTDLVEEMFEKVTVHENGKSSTLTKQRLMLKQLLNKAMSGHTASAKLILGWMQEIVQEQESSHSENEHKLSASDDEILRHHFTTHQERS